MSEPAHKFFFSVSDHDFHFEDARDTREAAAAAALTRWPHAEAVYTGVGVAADLGFFCSDLGDAVLTAVRDMARAETAAAEDWLRDVDEADRDDLDAKLMEVVHDFITINGYAPNWVTVEQIQKHHRGTAGLRSC